MSRKINILLRWLGILLLLLILLLGVAYFMLQMPKVQTKVVQYYTQKLSKDLNTKVEVGNVDVKFFKALTINDIYVEDHNQDTLFYAGKIHSKALLFQPFRFEFVLANSTLENVKLRLRRAPGDSLSNLDHLLASQTPKQNSNKKKQKVKRSVDLTFKDISMNQFDFSFEDSLKHQSTKFKVEQLTTEFKKFDLKRKLINAKYVKANEPYIALINTQEQSNEKEKPAVFALPKDWEFTVDDTKLINGQFINYGSPKKKGTEKTFAFNHFNWKPFTLVAKEIVGKENQLTMNIKELVFVDETGFRVDDFEAKAILNPDDIILNDLSISLDKSVIVGDVTMNYRDFNNFSDFENQIRLKADIEKIKLMPREFRLLFGSSILKEPVTISGQLQGKLNNLSTQNFYLEYQNGALVKGDIDARGLPDLQNTFFDAKIKQLTVTQNGLQQIMGKTQVPEQVRRLGKISFKGDFLGYITDLIAYGDLYTDIGDLNLDVKYTTDKYNNPVYSGYIETMNDFDLGYWLDNQDLGLINFAGNIAGTNFDLNTMDASANAKISRFDFQGKTINNIDFDGKLSQKIFTTTANINDEVFDGLVNATLDFSKPNATLSLNSDVTRGDLYALGLMDSPFEVKGKYTAELTGNSVSELQGEIKAENAFVMSDGKPYDLGNIGLSIAKKEGKQSVKLTAENASAEFIGNYNYTQLYPTVLKTLNAYYDFDQGWDDLENTVENNEEIGFSVEIKPGSELTKLILPDMKLNSAVNAQGLLNPYTNEISVLALADSLAFKQYAINNWQLDAYGDGKTLIINSFQDDISNNNKKWLTDSDLNIELSRDDILVDVRTYNDNFLSAKITSRIKRNGDEFKASILSSDLIVNGEQWTIQEGNSITLGGGTWKAENFTLQNGEQQITIFNPPNNDATKLIANLEKIKVTDLNDLVGFTQKPFEGELSGKVNLIDYQNQLNLDISLIIKDLLYNNDLVDVVSLEGLYNLDTKIGRFDGVANDDDFQFVIDSKLDLNKQQDILELNIDIVKSSLSPFENLWNTSISNVDGFVNGNIHIIGGPKTFNLDGQVDIIEDVYTTLNFTQARYKVPAGQSLKIVRNGFQLNNLKMIDPYGSEAFLNGSIIHSDLANFTLNINGVYNNFLFLDTTPRDNEVFYGKAFASGTMNFTGPVEDAFMNVNASSEPKTQIFIATPSAQNTSKYSFIRFRQPEKDTLNIEEKTANKSKLTMQFNLDITPNAEANLLFDSEGYNTIRGNGYGNLRVDIDTEDLLKINGIYEVNQGAYVVNFKDIFERDFEILPGGIIQWAEDPFAARLDINARYQLKADVSALVTNNNRYLADAITDLNVNIYNTISEPKFDYNIQVDRAQAGSEINDQLRIINNDKTKLDNQIGSLLLLKQFSNINSDPFSTQRSLEGIAINSVTNILTAQLSSLLSESGIFENTEIGIDYDSYQDLIDSGQIGDLGYGQRVQLQLSSRFLNDRIEVEYGGDFNFGDGLDNNINTFQVGDFIFTYRLKENGNTKFTIFSLRDYSIIQQKEQRRHGFGFIIEKEFDRFKEIFEKEEKQKESPQKNLPPEKQPAIDPNKKEEN